jgi:hypothetical protein
LIQWSSKPATPGGLLDLRAAALSWIAASALSTLLVWRIARRVRRPREIDG